MIKRMITTISTMMSNCSIPRRGLTPTPTMMTIMEMRLKMTPHHTLTSNKRADSIGIRHQQSTEQTIQWHRSSNLRANEERKRIRNLTKITRKISQFPNLISSMMKAGTLGIHEEVEIFLREQLLDLIKGMEWHQRRTTMIRIQDINKTLEEREWEEWESAINETSKAEETIRDLSKVIIIEILTTATITTELFS